LSINPINGHIVELLNLALETSVSKLPRGTAFPGGEVAYKKTMATLQQKYKVVAQQVPKMKGRETERVPAITEDDMAVG
jgi:anaphase-promoting complex subunit 6